MREDGRQTVVAFLARIGEVSWVFFIVAFVLAYAVSELRIQRAAMMTALLAAASVALILAPLFGALSDRLGRRPVYVAGAALLTAYICPFQLALETREPVLLGGAIVLGLG